MKLYENENLAEIPKASPIDKKIDKMLEELEKEQTERKKLESTIIPKAIFYQRTRHISFAVAGIAAIVMLITVVVSVTTHREIHPYLLLLISNIVMIVGFATFSGLSIAKIIWERRLRKVGIYNPIEYD